MTTPDRALPGTGECPVFDTSHRTVDAAALETILEEIARIGTAWRAFASRPASAYGTHERKDLRNGGIVTTLPAEFGVGRPVRLDASPKTDTGEGTVLLSMILPDGNWGWKLSIDRWPSLPDRESDAIDAIIEDTIRICDITTAVIQARLAKGDRREHGPDHETLVNLAHYEFVTRNGNDRTGPAIRSVFVDADSPWSRSATRIILDDAERTKEMLATTIPRPDIVVPRGVSLYLKDDGIVVSPMYAVAVALADPLTRLRAVAAMTGPR